MSYNGIGLQTARGSGTSGHIQTNLAKRDVKPKRRKIAVQDTRNRLELGSAIRKHNSKREIQVKCMELRDELEDQGLDDQVIDNRVQELKQKLEKEEEQEDEKDEHEDNEHTHEKDKENGDEEENKDGENKDEEEYKDENRHKHEIDKDQESKYNDNDKGGDLKYNNNDKDEDDKHDENNTEECEHEENNEKDHNATGYDYQTGNYTKLETNHKNPGVITELTQHKPVHELSQIKTSHHDGKKDLKGGKGDVDRETVAAASSKSVPEYIPRYKK